MGECMGGNYGHLSFSFNELGAMGPLVAINSHIQTLPCHEAPVYIFIYLKKKLSPIPPIAPSALIIKGNSEYESPIFPPSSPITIFFVWV